MNFPDLISIENLFQAWDEFRRGKGIRKDVQTFERNLEDNLFSSQKALRNKTYRHGKYQAFYVHDPKKRHIHKASVEDRIIHHLLYKYLYELFDSSFIYDSYSCRLEKGTHKAVERLEKFTRQVSRNYTRDCWTLKLDIKQFFASVGHQILKELLRKKIKDINILWLLDEIIDSFPEGIPLGNLTSQVFANIYLNELDKFIKEQLKVKYYIRYADDFALLSKDKRELQKYISPIGIFLRNKLKMELHPKKIIFRNPDWGIDFLGYVLLPHYLLPKTKTKNRVLKRLKDKMGSENYNQALQSYLGYLSHANSFRLKQRIKNQVWLWEA